MAGPPSCGVNDEGLYFCLQDVGLEPGGGRLNPEEYQEALRRYKNKRLNGHERQRDHGLLLVTKGYSYRQIADRLLVDEETISRWVRLYQEQGLAGLKNHPHWGGEQGQCWLSESEATQLRRVLAQEARPGTAVGSGWTVRAIRALLEERFQVHYRGRGARTRMRGLQWS